MWTILKSIVPTLNWWRLLAYGLVVAAVLGGTWGHGYYKASVNCEREKADEVAKQAKAEKKETEERVPVVVTREVESAKQRAEIARLKEALDEAISNRPDNPSCALSDDERDAFNELSKRTRK